MNGEPDAVKVASPVRGRVRASNCPLRGAGRLGLILLVIKLHQVWVGETFILGYVLHLFADAIAGGVLLMWPYPKRFGVALVKTAGMFDRMISVLCVVLLIGVILG